MYVCVHVKKNLYKYQRGNIKSDSELKEFNSLH